MALTRPAGSARTSAWGSSRPALIGLLLAIHLAFGLTMAARALGWLQRLELQAYDWSLGLLQGAPAPDPGLIVVEYRGEDEQRFGYPLPDGPLADLLALILAEQPAAIGLDLIRDRPEPPGGEGFGRLSALLDRHPEIVGIVWSQAGEYGPPPALAGRLDRLGAADMLEDPDKTVRRGLLFVEIGGQAMPSLALQLALRQAERAGLDGAYEAGRLRLGATTYRPLGGAGFYPGEPAARAGDQFLLTLPACAGGIPAVAMHEVLAGRAAGRFAGQIVLIGNTKRSYQDYRAVPLACAGSPDRTIAGVHLHGQMVRQLLDQASGQRRPLETSAQKLDDPLLGRLAEAGWIWLWTLPGGLSAALLASPWLIGAGFLAAVGLLLAVSAAAFAWLGWWLPVVPPLLGYLLASLLAIAWLLMLTRAERSKALGMLAGLLSGKVAQRLFQRADTTPAGLGPEPMMATVLFSDIVGFTGISERLPEQLLAVWLNEYMSAMVALIERHGGVVEKFAGDGITAEFGVPEGHTEPEDIAADARAALDTALAMGAALAGLNRGWQARGLPAIGLRIGIHSGPLMVGAIGSDRRWQYSIIGDTANTAARLESYAKDDPALACGPGHSRILASGVTLAHAGPGYAATFVGDLALRGKAQPVPVYRVDGRGPDPP